jgi:hypothetical protein
MSEKSMFAVAAVVLGGFTLYNLAGTKTSTHAQDPQKRLQNEDGNAHQKYKMNEVLTSFMAPLLDYPTRWMVDYTTHRKVLARLNQESKCYSTSKKATNDIIDQNLRRGSGMPTRINAENQVSYAGYQT